MSSRRPTSVRRALVSTVGIAAALAVGASSASAMWSSSAAGSAAAASRSLAAPTSGSAGSATTTTLAISWVAPENSSGMPVSYTVTRDGGAAADACTGISTPRCTDTFASSTSSQTFTYVVTAKVGSWTTASLPFHGSAAADVPAIVAPTITSPTDTNNKQNIPNGTSKTFTVTGTGLATGVGVTTSGEGSFIVGTVTRHSATSLTVTITARNGNGHKGDGNLIVTNPDGGSATALGAIANT